VCAAVRPAAPFVQVGATGRSGQSDRHDSGTGVGDA
jgi:hypothetical protein